MKRLLWLVFALFVPVVFLAGCGTAKGLDIMEKGITEITISTLPESDSYTRTYALPEKINAVVQYLNSLSLTENFSENPDEYEGMTFTITITYEDGRQNIVYHFGNMFVSDNTHDWLGMSYEEANHLYQIVQQNPSD